MILFILLDFPCEFAYDLIIRFGVSLFVIFIFTVILVACGFAYHLIICIDVILVDVSLVSCGLGIRIKMKE